jgi:hypothetical protein
MVRQNLRQAHLQEITLMQILAHYVDSTSTYFLFIQVSFIENKVSCILHPNIL